MKKWYSTAGVLAVVALLTLVFYMNKKPVLPSDGAGVEIARLAPIEVDHGAQGDAQRNESLLKVQGPATTANQVATTSSASQERMRKVESFIARSRLAEEFRFLDEQMAAQEAHFQSQGFSDSPEDQAALDEMRAKLSSEVLLEGYKKAMLETFNDAELAELNEIYKNPAIERLKDVEAYNRTPQGLSELADYAKNFNPKNVPLERLNAIKEYVKASGAAENMGEVFESVKNLVDTPNSKGQNKDMKGFQSAMENSIFEALVPMTHKMFEGLSEEDIRNAALLQKNPVLQKETKLKTGYMIQVMHDTVGPKLTAAQAMNR